MIGTSLLPTALFRVYREEPFSGQNDRMAPGDQSLVPTVELNVESGENWVESE